MLCVCFDLAKKPKLKSKTMITRFRSKTGADPLNSPFTLRAEPSRKLSDTDHFWNRSVPGHNRHKNRAGPHRSSVNRRAIRYGFRGAPIIDPV